MLPDLLGDGLDIVFCGTAAGLASARRKAYYAGPGNAFWPTLYKVGLTPRLFAPEEYAELRALRLGLTDLVKTASGNDKDLPRAQFDPARLRRKIRRFRPRILAFTSKAAARAYLGVAVDYGLQPAMEGDTRFFVLPSPSGAARRYWREAPWRGLSALRTALIAAPRAERRSR